MSIVGDDAPIAQSQNHRKYVCVGRHHNNRYSNFSGFRFGANVGELLPQLVDVSDCHVQGLLANLRGWPFPIDYAGERHGALPICDCEALTGGNRSDLAFMSMDGCRQRPVLLLASRQQACGKSCPRWIETSGGAYRAECG